MSQYPTLVDESHSENQLYFHPSLPHSLNLVRIALLASLYVFTASEGIECRNLQNFRHDESHSENQLYFHPSLPPSGICQYI